MITDPGVILTQWSFCCSIEDPSTDGVVGIFLVVW